MRKRSIRRLLILVATYSLVANFAHPVEPTFFKDLGLPDYMFGVAFASMSTVNFLFSPFWGMMSDRYGPNRILSIAYPGYAVGMLMFFLADSVMDIVIARAFAGIFISAISVSHILYIIENSKEEEKGQNLASFATTSAIFSAFGYLVGGVLGDISIPGDFITMISGLVILGGLHFFLLDDLHRHHKKSTTLELFREANPLKAFISSKEVFSVAFVAFLTVVMFTTFAATCYEQCFNYFIKDQYGFPPSYNGYLKGAVGIITLIANSTICSFLLKRTNINRSIIYVLGVCLAMMIGIVLLNSVVPFIILNVVFFGFNAVYKPLLQSMLNRFGKKSSGSVVGVYNSTNSVGTIAGSLTSGFIYTIHPKAAFLISAIAFTIAILFALLHRNKTRMLA